MRSGGAGCYEGWSGAVANQRRSSFEEGGAAEAGDGGGGALSSSSRQFYRFAVRTILPRERAHKLASPFETCNVVEKGQLKHEMQVNQLHHGQLTPKNVNSTNCTEKQLHYSNPRTQDILRLNKIY